MSENTLNIAVVFGGRSAEHEVSLQSARNVIRALDRNRFHPLLIGIDRDGRWLRLEEHQLQDGPEPSLPGDAPAVGLIPCGPEQHLICLESYRKLEKIDVLFPVLHGPYGEDGSIQGLARMANLPCVGAGVLGSSVGMDKDIMKQLLIQAGIPTARSITLSDWQQTPDPEQLTGELGLPLFVKPANMGSSVGVSKVTSTGDLLAAIKHAFGFDQKVIIEEAINGRELEVSVLGNQSLDVSAVGEIITSSHFYSYESKYIDAEDARLAIPADLPEETASRVRALAEKTFRVLNCCGLARVDLFLESDGRALVNEINTLPGFTNISMYPKLWEVSGLPQTDLISRLIDLAVEQYDHQASLKTCR